MRRALGSILEVTSRERRNLAIALRDGGELDSLIGVSTFTPLEISPAHPDSDADITRQDAEDLQAFVYAITEYIYDLADRCEEFKERQAERKRPRRSAAEMFASVTKKGDD